MLASSYQPLIVSGRSMLGPLGNEQVTLVLRDNGVRGFVQAHKRPHFPEIDVSYLATFRSRDGTALDGDTTFRMLEGLIERAGHARIERIFATVVPRFDDMAEVLRQRRMELGMSQADLADAAGVDKRQIRRYETGEQQPVLSVAVAIADE